MRRCFRHRGLSGCHLVTWWPSRPRRWHRGGWLVSAVVRPPGTRAYLSAGLPGADWWVAGGAAASAENADVELDEVEQFYTQRKLWNTLL